MVHTELRKNTLEKLSKNLKTNCCQNEITSIIKRLKSTISPHVKLYDTIEDACSVNNNYQWYLLDEICNLNNHIERPNGLNCHECKEPNSNFAVCVFSLRIDENENTRFSRIDNLEIFFG